MAGLCWFQTIAGRCPDSALRGRSVLRSDHNHHVVRAQYGQPRRTEVSRGKWQACVGFKRLPEGVLTLRFEAGQYSDLITIITSSEPSMDSRAVRKFRGVNGRPVLVSNDCRKVS